MPYTTSIAQYRAVIDGVKVDALVHSTEGYIQIIFDTKTTTFKDATLYEFVYPNENDWEGHPRCHVPDCKIPLKRLRGLLELYIQKIHH